MTLWLDEVASVQATTAWFELETDDLAAATSHLTAGGGEKCDELEPFPALGRTAHWIRDPAGTVHLERTADMTVATS